MSTLQVKNRDEEETYASVKKPTPATRQTFAWNQLDKKKVNCWQTEKEWRTAYENLALSTSAKAARRRSSRMKAASPLWTGFSESMLDSFPSWW